jgi:hypothetical protein
MRAGPHLRRLLASCPHPRHGDPDDDRGAVALVVAAMLVVFLGLAAIVVDLGFARDQNRIAQNAADAGALAAAQYMASSPTADPNQAAVIGRQYIEANGWTTDASTVRLDTAAGTVDIVLPSRTSPGFFSGIVGGGRAPTGASAQATWKGGVALSCVFCVLGDFQGQVGDVVTAGGGVGIGGALTFSPSDQGSITIQPPSAGDVRYFGSWDGNGTFNTPVLKSTVPVPDPYASLPLPPAGLTVGARAQAGSGACGPGVYTDVSRCTSLTGGGVYVLTGSRFQGPIILDGINAPDTTLYVTCYGGRRGIWSYQPCGSAGARGGAELGGTGNASSVISAPATGAYAGLAVIFDRALTGNQTFVGNAQLTLNGDVYGKSITLDDRGNGMYVGNGNVVVGGVQLKGAGSAKLHMQIQGRGSPFTVPGPGGPVLLTR